MMYTNKEMVEMVEKLRPLLSHRDVIGYAAARNTRILLDCLTEFNKFKEDLLREYGEQDYDEEGNELPTVSICYDSPNFKEFADKLESIASVKHNAAIMTLKYNEVVGLMNGEEILNNDWMLED